MDRQQATFSSIKTAFGGKPKVAVVKKEERNVNPYVNFAEVASGQKLEETPKTPLNMFMKKHKLGGK